MKVRAFAMGLALGAWLLTPLGQHVETALFLEPASLLRRALGRNPQAAPELRFILMEDRALARLGRVPSAREWHEVAERLRGLGYERILFLGLQTPGEEPTATPAGFVQGVVDVRDGTNLRAVPAAQLGLERLVAAKGAGAAWPAMTNVLGLAGGAGGTRAPVGLVNLPSANEMPAAMAVGPDALVPNIGLWAARTLAWTPERGLEADGRAVGLSYGDRLLVNYLDYREILKNAVAAHVLFSPELTPAVAEKLRGGRVAVIAPDAWTGTRFVDTGLGPMPTFVAAASVASSVMTGAYLVEPFPPVFYLLPLALVAWVVARQYRQRWCVPVLAAATLVPALVGTALFVASARLLPAAGMTLLLAAATIAAASARSLHTLTDKLRLQADLELGRTVQRQLLAGATEGRHAGWSYRVRFQPHGPMSGDWYQVHHATEDASFALVAIGDVVGKGASAALCTAVIAAAWASLTERWRRGPFDLAAAVATLHQSLWTLFGGSQNTTLSLALLTDKAIHIASLGAPGWLVVTRGLEVLRPNTGRADPIGLVDELPRPSFVRLEAHDLAGAVVAAYTDGVMDGSKARRQFEALLARSGATPRTAEEAFALVEATLRQVGSQSPQPDDATIVMIHRAA